MAKLTFEKACEITGTDPNILPGVDGLPEIKAKRILADYKLEILMNATNGDFVPDFSNWSQDKFIPWLEWSPSLGVFVYSHTTYTRTNSYLGARFCFADRNTAIKFAKDHIDLINDLHR